MKTLHLKVNAIKNTSIPFSVLTETKKKFQVPAGKQKLNYHAVINTFCRMVLIVICSPTVEMLKLQITTTEEYSNLFLIKALKTSVSTNPPHIIKLL